MSAFVVGPETLHAAVLAMWGHDEGAVEKATLARLTALGRKLLALNVAAVSQRYPHDKPDELPGPQPTPRPEDYAFPLAFAASLAARRKALDCLVYQCIEGDVPDRPLFKEMRRKQEELAALVPADSAEYKAVPWGD